MKVYLGIDTSNYTTSAALITEDGEVLQSRKLLPVKAGEVGLRQSDAVFHHTQQLPEQMERLFAACGEMPCAIGVSTRPRNVEGSYMPCFTVGVGLARSLAAVLQVPLFEFSHQQGHIAAALHSCGREDLFGERFLAFHVSGGTTEALLVEPKEEDVFHAELVASSLDLKAGQAIDRVGNLLGLPFPAGKYLDELAQSCKKPRKGKAVLKDGNCCLSGIENQCRKLWEQGVEKETVARFCIDSVKWALEGMTEWLVENYGELPLVYAGGVMSNRLIREEFVKKYHANFAAPEFSSDNAAGIAVLTQRKMLGLL
jgi:N6-L-threonylcarbamoyladenine synthase